MSRKLEFQISQIFGPNILKNDEVLEIAHNKIALILQ